MFIFLCLEKYENLKKKIKLKAFLNFKKMKIEPRFSFFIF